MLDPTVCERDSDCGGGVCQVGICVGPRTSDPDPSDDMSVAGEPDAQVDAGGAQADLDPAGEEVLVDMDPAGMSAGELIADSDVPLEVICAFEISALTEQGVRRRDLPPI